eukprot:g32846.t1
MTQEENHDSSTFSTNEDGQISRTERGTTAQPPPPPPLPPLEQVARAEDTGSSEIEADHHHEDQLDEFSL